MAAQQRSAGQWFVSGEGTRWFFDAGALCLDFAFTGGVDERPEWEQFRTSADLAGWLAGRVPGYDVSGHDVSGYDREHGASDAVVNGLELRGAVFRLARQAAAKDPLVASDVDVVNRFAERPDVPRRLEGGSSSGGHATLAQALSSVARDAVDAFGSHLDRVRECGAEDCPLVFLDLSRAGIRRWCSMQRCGNRHKVRSHRARQLDSSPKAST